MFKRIPNHIGVIPDGNRRWAEGQGLHKKEGYDFGIKPGFTLYEEMLKHGIKEATFYGFTHDNTKRATEQREAFTKACIKAVNLLANRDADLLVIGNTNSSAFPSELLPYANKRVHFGKGLIKLNFLVNYDWEWDLKTALETGGRIASADISRMDMVIRWGGRRRLSGFLPVQSVYSDIYVVEEYWPDFKKQQFLDALQWYQDCDVTLGG